MTAIIIKTLQCCVSKLRSVWTRKINIPHWILPTRPGQIYFRKNALNFTVKFAPNCGWRPILSQFGCRLTTRPGLRSSQVEPILTAVMTFGGLAAWLNNFRIGWKLVSSHGMGQISLWSLRHFSEKNLAWPSVRIYKRFIEVQLTISFIEQRVGVQNPSQAIYQIDAFLWGFGSSLPI